MKGKYTYSGRMGWGGMRDQGQGGNYHWLLRAARTVVDVSIGCAKKRAKEGLSQQNEHGSEDKTRSGGISSANGAGAIKSVGNP